jgi:UDP-3-O-[3-hydroxymyristoyl] N-acetylglucosamine deacetylase
MKEARTLCQRSTVAGRGLGSGAPVVVHLLPAEHPSGIRVFDAQHGEWIPARVANVLAAPRTTELGGARGHVRSVEHLLAACHGLGICCLSIVAEGSEAPGLDGSALDWVHAMDRAGLTSCGGRSQPLVGRAVSLEGDGSAAIRYVPSPDDGLEISYTVDFRAHGGAREELSLAVDEATFRRELAAARTFAVRGVDPIALAGVGRPALWTDSPREERRFSDELVRHKALDLLGDLALLGRPLAGRLEAHCAGHGLHRRLAMALAEAGPA